MLEKIGLRFNIIETTQKEKYPISLKEDEIAMFLAKEKNIKSQIKRDQLIITADTIVISNDIILNKPKDKEDAFNMLYALSKKWHKVITGVYIRTINQTIAFSCETKVNFRALSKSEIQYYINNYNYLDKAGSYAIQEWIGMIGVEKIDGCYYNVMGLPLSKLYQELKKIT